MGSDRYYPDEGPTHNVTVDEFWIDQSPVTNKQFDEFVSRTGYVTLAEIAPTAEDYPDAPVENLVPGALVFVMPPGPVHLDDFTQWWAWTPRG